MTAIAFKDGILAADKAETWGGMQGATTKIFIMNGHKGAFIGAFCGSKVFITQMVEYFNSTSDAQFPDIKPFNENGHKNGYGFLWNLDTRDLWEITGGGVLLPQAKTSAVSGCVDDFLYGAMVAGLSSVQAICKAHLYTESIGFGVDYIDVNKASDVWKECSTIKGFNYILSDIRDLIQTKDVLSAVHDAINL